MEVMFVCAYQCYTPPGPLLSDTSFWVWSILYCGCRQQGYFSCLFISCHPFGVGLSPFSLSRTRIFFCLLLGATPVSPPGHECCRTDKDLFFVFYWVFVGYALSCEQRLIFWFFWVLVGSVYSCVANSRVLLYGV